MNIMHQDNSGQICVVYVRWQMFKFDNAMCLIDKMKIENNSWIVNWEHVPVCWDFIVVRMNPVLLTWQLECPLPGLDSHSVWAFRSNKWFHNWMTGTFNLPWPFQLSCIGISQRNMIHELSKHATVNNFWSAQRKSIKGNIHSLGINFESSLRIC